MTTVTTEALVKKLAEGVVAFKYTKTDGTIREATGTTKADLIPEDVRASAEPIETSPTCAYWDTGVGAWRSFRKDAVVA